MGNGQAHHNVWGIGAYLIFITDGICVNISLGVNFSRLNGGKMHISLIRGIFVCKILDPTICYLFMIESKYKFTFDNLLKVLAQIRLHICQMNIQKSDQ